MFKIIAGDIPHNLAIEGSKGYYYLADYFHKNNIKLTDNIEKIEFIREETVRSFGNTGCAGILGGLGFGIIGVIIGFLIFPPIGLFFALAGLLAGVITGGKEKQMQFACYLKDGRKFIAVCDPKTYYKIFSLNF